MPKAQARTRSTTLQTWRTRWGGLLLAVLLIPPTTAAASMGGGHDEPRLVSRPDALPDHGSVGACGSEHAYQGWDQEATLAASAQGRLVTAWTQDYADAISVAYSDNGQSWTQVLPATTECTGGLDGFNSAYDAWLSVGPRSSDPALDRVVYLSSAVKRTGDLTTDEYATVVNRSLDGGRTWSPPVEVTGRASKAEYLDGSTVTADPYHAGVAYVTWRRGDYTFANRSQYVAKTIDGGRTWSAPVRLPAVQMPTAGNLAVLSDGTLLDVFVEVPPQPGFAIHNTNGPSTIRATRSTDGGATWSPPSLVAVADPRLMVMARVAVAPDGSVFVSWQRASTDDTNPSFALMLSRSGDGGRTWAPPQAAGAAIPGPPEYGSHGTIAAAPSLAVAADGTLGIGFYDHRNDVAGSSPPKITDYWFRWSSDGGTTWRERHLAGPFDQTTAPSDQGPVCCPGFLGDSQGIAPVPGGFALTYTLAGPLAVSSPSDGATTDIFFSRVAP